ncbi:MAG TPA: UvrB/UvrC motif-containing protein [Symbiobacteriaceae bacterium]|nr:UvrB/UvrC motif-containing protein [Symbiobacteriaceae bacterium]
MQCENCGQRPAVVHSTMIVNGQKQETHLCEVCAQEKGQVSFSFPNLSIQQLLSSFLGQDPFAGARVAPQQAEPTCKNCGMTYSQFADGGRLGCAQCYDYLEPYLNPLIKRIQGTTTHAGKAPKRTGGVVRKRRELAALRQDLSAAIQGENYEEAARLRDQIKALESQIQAGGDGGVVE